MAVLDALLKIRASVDGEGSVQALGRALGSVNTAAGQVSTGLRGMAGSVGSVAGAMGTLTPLLSAAGLIGMAKASLDTADKLWDMSQRTGVSVEMLAKLKKAASTTGTDIDAVGNAIVKLSKSIAASVGDTAGTAARTAGAGTTALQNSLAAQVAAYEQNQQQMLAAVQANADRQVQAVQSRERREIEAVRAAQDRALQVVRDGERRQIQAVEQAAADKLDILEDESTKRLREISRRYREEQKILNDNYDDQRDAAQQSADEEQRILERKIERSYDKRRKAINDDKTLSDEQRTNLEQQLQDQQDAELRKIRETYNEKAKIRNRAFRDEQDRRQQAIDDQQQLEEETAKAGLETLKQTVEQRAKAEKDAITKAAAQRQAAIKKDAAEQERIIKEGADAAVRAIREAAKASTKALKDSSAQAKDAFQQLGISVTDSSGKLKNSGQILLEIANKFKQMPDGAIKTALALKLFGRSGAEMIPLLNEGGDAIDKLRVKMTTAFAQRADEYNDKLAILGGKIGGIGADIATILLPALDATASILTTLADGFNMLPGPIKAIIGGIVLLTALFVALAPAISAVISIAGALATLQIGATIAGWLGIVGPAVGGIIAAFTGLLAWLTGTLVPALIGIFSGPVGWTILAVAAVVAMAIAFREPIMRFLGWLGEMFMQGLKALGQLAFQIFVQPWISLWNNVLRGPVTAMLEWIRGVFTWYFQALYAIAWQLFVQPFINLWENALRGPVTALLQWLQTVFPAAMKALYNLAWQLYVQPWINLWQVVLRKPVTGAITWFSNTFKLIGKAFSLYVVTPLQTAWQSVVNFIQTTMTKAGNFLRSIWVGIINGVRGVFNSFLQNIANNINNVAGLINRLIGAFNSLPGPDIPFVPMIQVPRFAEGGVVDRGTLALVGEAEREYIIPERKMASASAAYLAGVRGSKVISAANTAPQAAGSSPQINIQTGPVMEFNGERFVKIEDLERAMRTTADGVISKLRTPSARIALGLR